MKYVISSQDKEAMIDFDKLKEGEVFSFFDPESVQRGNHAIYMKIRVPNTTSVNLIDLEDGKAYDFSNKKRNTINDPDEKQGNRVYKLNAKINIVII
jgi:hypothetical protein